MTPQPTLSTDLLKQAATLQDREAAELRREYSAVLLRTERPQSGDALRLKELMERLGVTREDVAADIAAIASAAQLQQQAAELEQQLQQCEPADVLIRRLEMAKMKMQEDIEKMRRPMRLLDDQIKACNELAAQVSKTKTEIGRVKRGARRVFDRP